jgi:hypothetical protein
VAAVSYLRLAIAPTTRKTYDVAVAAFRRWRVARGELPDLLPTTDEIGGWLADNADQGGLRAATLRVYVSAISTWWAEARHPDSREPNPAADPLISRLLKGIQRQEVQRAAAAEREGRAPHRAKASELMLPTLLKYRFSDSPRDRMLFAAACLGVAGGMRASELLGSADYPERALTRDQLSFYAGAADGLVPIDAPHSGAAAPAPVPVVLEVLLRVTKTTQMSSATKVIAAPSVVAAVWRWVCASSARAPADLLFELGDAPLTTGALCRDLERRRMAAGLGTIHYSGKAWRRGGAATLAALGYDAAAIAALGWAEDSAMWERYVQDPGVRRARALMRGTLMEPGRDRDGAAAAARR